MQHNSIKVVCRNKNNYQMTSQVFVSETTVTPLISRLSNMVKYDCDISR